ncbi:SemiSWEET transporter [Methylobacterium sp. A54F]
MDLSLASAFGLGAVICTTLAYVPQVLKAWRTRSTGDVSLGMFLFMVVGMACWLVYGLLIGDLPLTVANAITLSLASVILVLKLRHG